MPDASAKVSATTQIVHIGSGTSLAAGAYSPASDVSTALSSTNTIKYPRADITLMIAPTAAVTSASQQVYLWRRDLNIDSTNDDPVPTASNQAKLVGNFTIPYATTASTTHYVHAVDVPLPGDSAGAGACEFFISNGLAVNIPIGWTLKVSPKTDVGATA